MDIRGMVGGTVNDGISVGGRLGVEAEGVADRRVPPEGARAGMMGEGEEGFEGIG